MIRFENVSKSFKNTKDDVVKNISFEIEKGELVVLIGPSGCGKTTCLKMINRLEETSQGKIYINGKANVDYNPIKLRRSQGYVIQQVGLFPHMTIRDNIEIVQRLNGINEEMINKRTKELMKMISLDEEYLDRYPTQLSGGQQQRIGVARAFALNPEIILMDEPFSALDPLTRSQLQDELLAIQRKIKKTIVFVTHDMNEAIKLADRICIMKEGEIIQYDTPEVIMKHPVNDYVQDFVGKNRIWSNPQYIYAKDIVSEAPIVILHDMTLKECEEKMENGCFTHALATNKRKVLIGVIDIEDIRKRKYKNKPVSILCKYPEVLAHDKDNLLDLVKMFDENHFSSVPVIDEQRRLLGIITKNSLVSTLSHQYMVNNNKEVNADA